jgi:electron transport complex protein RnfB
MLTGVLIMSSLAALTAIALCSAAARIRVSDESPVEQVNRLLPQTQCAQCGFPGCMPYAEALISGTADINQCAPGGETTVNALARLLGKDSKPLNPMFGQHQPQAVALINEATCIGCTLCIEACPVDAIIGAAQFTHTVIRAECTGCELCLAPCPVDCISLVPGSAA